MKIYCDTCIYRDLFEGRKGRWIDFGDVALDVFRAVREKKYTLIISDWVIDEFKKYKDVEVLNEFIDSFKKESIIKIEREKEDKIQAKKLSKTNYDDALHVILAKKANAVYLVTRNIKDFNEFNNLIEVVTPESLP